MPGSKPVIKAELVTPFDQLKVYGPLPPEILAVALPFAQVGQVALVCESDAIICVGCVRISDDEPVQPLLSVTVTVYVPAKRPLAQFVVCPFDQV